MDVEMVNKAVHLYKLCCDSRLTYSWFTDQDGIVLFTPAQNLSKSFNFRLPSYNGIQAILFRGLGKVYAKIIKNRGV